MNLTGCFCGPDAPRRLLEGNRVRTAADASETSLLRQAYDVIEGVEYCVV